jgi:hypothetical protein
MLQKIEQFKQMHLSQRQGHSPRPRGEDLPRQHIHLRHVPVLSLAFGNLDLPLIAVISIDERERKITCTQEVYKA